MSDGELEELSWDQFFGSKSGYWDNGQLETYDYDGVTLLRDAQTRRAEADLEIAKIIDREVNAAKSGSRSLYFRITAGARAGTIMRLANPAIFQRYQHDREPATRATQPVICDVSNRWRGVQSGAVWVDGNMYVPSDEKMIFEVDGRDDITFSRSDSALRTTKPALVLGYKGPTVWQYGKPEKARVTMKDRYNQDVGVGDVVLLGLARTGTLLTGKIERMSDKGTIWIKHIGAKDPHKEMNCTSEQILLLKDVERVLMMEKLRAL